MGLTLLPGIPWNTSYRHDDGDLVELFYIPALSCAVRYDRMTGYFTADALSLAARGIDQLIFNSGRMRMIVGCTLCDDEQAAISAGYAWKSVIRPEEIEARLAERMAAITFDPPDEKAKDGLGALAWMIAMDLLEIIVAIPVDPSTGQPMNAPGIYHEKVGMITDTDGNRISFSGSINETRGGWMNNRESFHVHCSWLGDREAKHVEDNVEAFKRQWENRSPSIRTFSFPEAARKKLLEFMPKDDRFVTPPLPPVKSCRAPQDAPGKEVPARRAALLPDEIHEVVWQFVGHAARLKNGIRLGEVTSAVKPWPHQTRSFVRMWDGWPCRLLDASEVGLGKTITAGMVIRQAWLSGRTRRVLLLVPKGIILQWQDELYEKFNLNVPIYDGHTLRWKKVAGWHRPVERAIRGMEWTQEPVVLASSQLMRRRDRANEIIDAEPWNLVILDEAHHARRRGAGTPQEKGPNQLLALMQAVAPRAKSLLLLTATPMQVHPIEVYDLLALLGMPAYWEDSAFIRYFELASRNPSHEDMMWLAKMFQATETEFGAVSEDDVARVVSNISRLARTKILKALRDKSGIPLKRLDGEARKAALEVLRRFSPVRHRMSRHTRSLLRAYHAKGLMDLPIATRRVHDIMIEMTATERALYEAIEAYISNTYNKASQKEKTAVGFVMTIYRRRLASSFNALKCTLIKRLQRVEPLADDEDASQDETRDDIMSGEEAAALARSALVAEETVEIKALLKAIEKAGTETKAKRLADEIEKLLENDYDSVIVFTQYTDTMDSLAEFLASRLPDLPIGTYSGKGGRTRDKGGTWTNCSKEHIKGALKAKRVRLLVATDAAGEGLNLQFCGVIVNYDLPWNPMKVEQRIGRIDRIGQVHKEVHVVSLAYKDTIEADVYLALGERINLFQGIVGKLQPILSRLPQEFERVVLERSENREATRQRFIADIENQVTQAELSPFDIDEVSADALEMPMLPDPPFTPEVLAEAMTLPGVKPSGWEWRRLDPGSCGLRVPGQDEIRVATTAEVFDAHPESMAFFTPGMPAFDDIIGDAEATQDVEPEPGTLPLVTVREDDGGEVFELNLPAFTGEVSNLGFLIEVLKGTGTAK